MVEDGIFTSAFFAIWALRIRVNISARVSCMLMLLSLRYSCLPAGLNQTWHITAHRCFTQFITTQTELAINAVRTTGDTATVTLTNTGRVAWKFLQLNLCVPLRFRLRIRILHNCAQGVTLSTILFYQFGALLFPFYHGSLGHESLPQPFSGKLKARNSARASSSVLAVVVTVISMPRSLSTLSYTISGNTICSRRPIESLPCPSNDFGFKPRKSRTRGITTQTRRSRNSYMRSLRKVTLTPIGQPSRILKPATDFRANVTIGF